MNPLGNAISGAESIDFSTKNRHRHRIAKFLQHFQDFACDNIFSSMISIS